MNANDSSMQTGEATKYYRFQVFLGEEHANGITKTKSVGMSYLREGQNIFTLRLWTFSWERYYIVPNKNDSSKVLIMTREPNRSPTAKNKYFWNIVGNGVVNSSAGVFVLEFDLLKGPIFMNMHPESSAFSVSLPEPPNLEEVA